MTNRMHCRRSDKKHRRLRGIHACYLSAGRNLYSLTMKSTSSPMTPIRCSTVNLGAHPSRRPLSPRSAHLWEFRSELGRRQLEPFQVLLSSNRQTNRCRRDPENFACALNIVFGSLGQRGLRVFEVSQNSQARRDASVESFPGKCTVLGKVIAALFTGWRIITG